MQNLSKLANLEIPKNRRELWTICEASDHPFMTNIWAQNGKFDKATTFEPDRIATHSKQQFAHLGEVDT